MEMMCRTFILPVLVFLSAHGTESNSRSVLIEAGDELHEESLQTGNQGHSSKTVPLTIITGFLGAGKSTLVKYVSFFYLECI